MKIGFVAEPYEEKNASGMGHVVLELIDAFLKKDSQNEFVVYSSATFAKKRMSSNATNVLIPKNFFHKIYWFFRNHSECDVLFFIVPLLPLILPRESKTILICQELASQKIKPDNLFESIKAFLRDKVLMPISLKRGSLIIAASNATKFDLLKFYNLNESKIKVIYNGYQKFQEPIKSSCNPNQRPYFFFAGKVKYRKNVHGIVEAFIKFISKHNVDCDLKIAGSYGGEYYENILENIGKNGLIDKVKFLGYADKDQMFHLYKNCVACLFPSINEGFGMPIVEAMSLGAPVVTSNISSMSEVAGEAGILVDPFNTDQLANAMWNIFSDKNLRNNLIKKGKDRSKLFSWDKAAKEYLENAYYLTDAN
ncbi:glycosyltransferase family 1 protein [Candidatus Parcubacteria bacterium]|nr:MAG: glycosyltransferase family 1 protein [Candidatus Parcubacteria bacterium]